MANRDSPAFSKQQPYYTSLNWRPLFAPEGQLYAQSPMYQIFL